MKCEKEKLEATIVHQCPHKLIIPTTNNYDSVSVSHAYQGGPSLKNIFHIWISAYILFYSPMVFFLLFLLDNLLLPRGVLLG